MRDEALPTTAHPALPDLGTRRFVFVTGKGGVGKTTVCAALGLALAARGKRVLVVMCHTKERLSALIGTPPIGDDIVRCADNLWAVNLSPEKALAEYGALILKVGAVARTVFDNAYVKAFFRAVPGLYEWSMLGKAWWHTTETDDRGRNRFDVVLFDAPATGHGLDMLRVPKVILDVVPPGILRRDAERAWAMFQNPKQSGVLVVTLPEEMPTTETLELTAAVRELGLPVLGLVVNGLMPALFDDAERAALLARSALLDIGAAQVAAGPAAGAVVAGARRAAREQVQRDSLAVLERELDLPRVLLPLLFEDGGSPAGTRALASRF
ncbi:MAG: ArsA family ATPase [Polyangiaceae bacterium]